MRTISIWDERKVFGSLGTKPFQELITEADAPNPGEFRRRKLLLLA